MDYQKCNWYFNGVHYGFPIFLLIMGIILFICGCNGSAACFVSGLALIVLSIWMIDNKRKQKVTDEEYEAEIAHEISEIEQRALNKLGLDKKAMVIDPIQLDHYCWDDNVIHKEGADGLLRSNRYEISMLFFTADEVHFYNYKFCTTQSDQKEFTDMYFYQDIVSVSTGSEILTICGSKQEVEKFYLRTAGGNALDISFSNVDDVQGKIVALRNLLREKKKQG